MAYNPRNISAPYPGFDESGQHVDPQPLARVKPEAEEFARKHKGVLDLFNPKRERIEQASPPEPRCPSAAARSNLEQHRRGNVGGILNGTATPRMDYEVVPRTKPEGKETAEVHRGSATANLFKEYGRMPASARMQPKVKREGEVNASLDLGGRAKNILHQPKEISETPRPDARVKPEGEGNAHLDKGGRMNKIINKYGTGSGTDRGVPRVKPEGGNNAFLNSGHRTSDLLQRYGKMPVEDQPGPRVTGPGQDYATLDKGGRMSQLMHEGSKARRSPRPPPRATTAEAKRLIQRNRGQIGQIFAASSSKTIIPPVGVRG